MRGGARANGWVGERGQGILILGALSDDIDGLMQVKDEIITECGSGFSGQGRLEAENQLPACSKNSGCVMVTDHTSIFIEEAIPGVMIFMVPRRFQWYWHNILY